MKNPGRNNERQTVISVPLIVWCVASKVSCSLLAAICGKLQVYEPLYRRPLFASRAAPAPALLFV